MRRLILLLTSATAWALPPIDEARKVLGAEQSKVRESLTLEIWQSGREALPLLAELIKDRNPEVALRARFVLQRLRMGLKPESPDDLLKLAQAVDEAKPELRIARLSDLLDHPEGMRAALVFLDDWASNPDLTNHHARILGTIITEALIERRAYWKEFLTTPLSPRCRGIIVAALAKNDFPMRSQMISALARTDTRLVYETASQASNTLLADALINLARVATISADIPLALEILEEGLEKAEDPELARAIAFLETGSGAAPIAYRGKWRAELELFRARARGDSRRVREISASIQGQPYLTYESRLLANSLTLDQDADDFSAPELLSAVHRSFASPPGEPDIEALTSSVLINWPELTRALTLLAHPFEASDRLASEGQVTTAIGLLWRTGHLEEARTLGENRLTTLEENDPTRIRLTLASLHLDSGELDRAQTYFSPVITALNLPESRRRATISLGLKLFPREKLLPLAPDLLSDKEYKRAGAISALLPYPAKVSVFWYEHFRKEDPFQVPEAIFKRVEAFLTGDPTDAIKIILKELEESRKPRLLPSDMLYHQVLFFQMPSALAMVEEAAWYQLSTSDLMSIAQDESWPLESRKKALTSAAMIDPANPVIHWHDQRLNGTLYPVSLDLYSLGDASMSLQLVSYTKRRNTLDLTCELANIKDHQALRCLAILGKFHLDNEQADEAARFLQTMLCGEIAAGNKPATPIQASIENLANYFRARRVLSETEEKKAIWDERLKMMGRS